MTSPNAAEGAARGRTADMFDGLRLVAWSTALVGAACAASLAIDGPGEAGSRLAIRTTARTSVALFSLAFTASALYAFWPGRLTRWARRNRRYLGLSFAVSHTFHLFFIVRVGLMPEGLGAGEPSLTTLVFGGFGYVMLYAMAATSNDRAVSWLGPRRWRRLHTFGGYYLWFIFFVTTAATPFVAPAYALYPLLLLGVLALRIAAVRRRRALRSTAA